MICINENYLKLQSSYLFSTIGKKVAAFVKEHPNRRIIRMGIGDVTLPLPPSVVAAFRTAVDEMGSAATFRGYDDSGIGYEFLREKIAEIDYKRRGVSIAFDEIFISDGSKCDTGNIQELFAQDAIVAVPDPVYPVYVDTNVMAGRSLGFSQGRYGGIVYLDSTEANGFVPEPPAEPVDLIYLCFPNNPTGATATREQLKAWVDYARKQRALILFDAAYVAYIRDESIPQSIFEIAGAHEVAIEFRSFSKTAGFTGTRCAFTVIPKQCIAYDSQGKTHSVHQLWLRRHTTKFNGVCYPVQRAAEAVYSPQGQHEIREMTDYYLENARMIRSCLQALNFRCAGGENAPYVWVKTGMDSWEFFDLLLEKAGIVCTPGSGFGACGNGYVRFSAFGSHDNVREGLERLHDLFSKGQPFGKGAV